MSRIISGSIFLIFCFSLLTGFVAPTLGPNQVHNVHNVRNIHNWDLPAEVFGASIDNAESRQKLHGLISLLKNDTSRHRANSCILRWFAAESKFVSAAIASVTDAERLQQCAHAARIESVSVATELEDSVGDL